MLQKWIILKHILFVEDRLLKKLESPLKVKEALYLRKKTIQCLKLLFYIIEGLVMRKKAPKILTSYDANNQHPVRPQS